MKINTTEQTLVNLYRTIQYRQKTGLSTDQFVFTFYQRLAQPLTTFIMICLAVPFVFGTFRSASTSLRIMTGVFIAFMFYMLNQLFGPITLVYQFPPLLAALSPTLVFSALTVILLRKTQ